MLSFFTSWPIMWVQAQVPANPAANPAAALSPRAVAALLWLYLASDSRVGLRDSLVGGVLTWVKAVSLLCLVCWVVAWLIIGVKERLIGQGRWFDFLGIAGAALNADCRDAQGSRRCQENRAVPNRRLLADDGGGGSLCSVLCDLG